MIIRVVLFVLISCIMLGCTVQKIDAPLNTTPNGPNYANITNNTGEIPQVNVTTENGTEVLPATPHYFSENMIVYFPRIGLYSARGMQGESIIVAQGSNITIINTGPKEQTEALVEYLHGKNIYAIDRMILLNTHPPYWDGFDGLSKEISIHEVNYVLDDSVYEPTYDDFMDEVKARYPTRQLDDGEVLDVGAAQIIVHRAGNPDLETYAPVLTFNYGNTCILYPSSSNYKSQREIINSFNIRCPVAIAAAHGLGYVSEDMYRFFFLMQPKTVIINGGPDENTDAQKGRGILYNVLDDLGIPYHKAFESPVEVHVNETAHWID